MIKNKPIGHSGNALAELPCNGSMEEILEQSGDITGQSANNPLKVFNSFLAQYHSQTIPSETFISELEEFIYSGPSNVVLNVLKNDPIVLKQLMEIKGDTARLNIIRMALEKEDGEFLSSFLIKSLKTPQNIGLIVEELFQRDRNDLFFNCISPREKEEWIKRAFNEGKVKIASQKKLDEIDMFIYCGAPSLLNQKRGKDIMKFLERNEILLREKYPHKFTELYQHLREKGYGLNSYLLTILDWWFRPL